MQFLGVAMCLDPKSSQWWILMIFLGKSRGTLKKKISDFPNVAIFDLFHGLEQPGCSKVVFMDIIGDFMKILWGQPQIFMGQSIGWLTKHNGNILSI